MRHAWLVPALLVLAPACAEHHDYTEGTICLDPAAPASFADGDALELVIILDDCMTCPKEFHAGCDISRDGDVIDVKAYGTYQERGGPCDSCIVLKTGCTIGGLTPGTYTIRSGDEELVVTLPSPDPVQLDPVCDKA